MLPALVAAALDSHGPVSCHADRLVRADGVAVVGLETELLDVLALDPDRRTALVAAVDRLWRTLETPLQVLVQARRWTVRGGPAAATGMPGRLATAELELERTMVEARPAFRRRIVVLATLRQAAAPSAGVLDPVEAALAAGGVATRPLDGTELARLVREAWGAGPDDVDTAEGVLEPPSWRAGVDRFSSGSVLYRSLRLRRLPGVAVGAGWLAPLLRVRATCDVALHLAPIPLDVAIARLGRRLRALRADQLVHLDRESHGDADVDAGVDSALELRDRLARNEGRPVSLSLTATARGRDLAELEASTAVLRVAFATALTRAGAAHLDHRAAALATWPLGEDRPARSKLVDSTAAASCVPFVEAVCDDPDGYLLGRAAGSDTPVRIAPFDRGHHANANVCVVAASGRGKSYCIGTLVLAAAARGVGSIIVDPEGEYETLVGALDGAYLHLRPGCGAALNVFDVGLDAGAVLEPTTAGATVEPDPGDTAVGAVVALVDILVGGSLGEAERAHVDAAARSARDHAASAGRPAVLGDCLPALRETAPRVAPVLTRFCSGPLGELFNRPTTVRLGEGTVGLGLRDLRDELVPAATLVVAEWLWGLVRRDRRNRHIVFDEVGLLCAHPALRTLLAQLARRCRKYGASLVVATQNAGDLLATEEGRVIATNPAVVLLGGHRGAETMRMQEAYALTDSQRAWLEGAARGEFLLLAGNRRLPIQIAAAPFQHGLITGTGTAAPAPPSPAQRGHASVTGSSRDGIPVRAQDQRAGIIGGRQPKTG